MQYWQTVELFNNQNYLTCGMSQQSFFDITMRQCHMISRFTCPTLVFLYLVLLLRFISLRWQPRIKILKVSVAIILPFIGMFYCTKKMKFPIKDFFSKYDQIRSFLRIWSYLLKKSLKENFIFCPVFLQRVRSESQLQSR